MATQVSLIDSEQTSHLLDDQENVLSVPFVIRGEVVEDFSVEIARRDRGYGQVVLKTPDLRAYLPKLVDVSPLTLKALADIPCDEIQDMLHIVGQAFAPGTKENALFAPIIEDAIRATALTSSLSESGVRFAYQQIPGILNRNVIDYVLEQELGGSKFLDGWVEVDQPAFAMESAITQQAREAHAFGTLRKGEVRAYPSKIMHIMAGNLPLVAALSIMRGGAIKSHNLFKMSSNDPYTAATILRVLVEMFPDHPLTTNLSAVYWKGADSEIEKFLYQPKHYTKVVAWGSHGGIQAVQKRLAVGMELITFDPKMSISIIGQEAFDNPLTLAVAVERTAYDILTFSQEACVCSRYQFVEGSEVQVAAYCEALYDYLKDYAQTTEPNAYVHPALTAVLAELKNREIARVWAGEQEGAVVMLDAPLDPKMFFPMCRTAAVTRVENISEVLQYVNVGTQTIGVYPDARKEELRDALIASGGQRIVSLGGAGHGVFGLPHDAFYPCHRMVRWAVDEHY
ncbi:MAG: acyl-CoA reductase [Candidatus Heimdallarchaeota archaeon]